MKNKNNIKIETITDPKKIAEIQPELDKLKQECLLPKFELNEIEKENFLEFCKTHGPRICKAEIYSTGECFTFSFMPTGIGVCKWVTCSCGVRKDITDLSDLDDF